VQRLEQVFLVLVFVVSLFFVWIAIAEKPEGFGFFMVVGTVMASSAMICWFIRGRSRRPPDAG
jgi:hypothetical protein